MKWSSVPVVDLSKNIRKNKKSSKIINPKFNCLSLIEDDNKWSEIFKNGGNAKFPKGFTWDEKESTIKFRRGAKLFELKNIFPEKIPETFEEIENIFDLENIKNKIKNFFQNYGVIYSDKDRKTNDEKKLSSTPVKSEKITAKMIKKNQFLLDHYIYKWLINVKEEHKLTKKDIESLKYIIEFGFSFGFLSDKDLVFDQDLDTITEIKNIYYEINDNQRNYKIYEKHMDDILKKKKICGKKVYVKPMERVWLKYLDKFKNAEVCVDGVQL